LEHWAVKLGHHADATAVYIFANNHYEGMGVETARCIAAKLGISLPAVARSPGQLDLFGPPRAG
jgi:uncharacterized protein YecE (DUF72 family)